MAESSGNLNGRQVNFYPAQSHSQVDRSGKDTADAEA